MGSANNCSVETNLGHPAVDEHGVLAFAVWGIPGTHLKDNHSQRVHVALGRQHQWSQNSKIKETKHESTKCETHATFFCLCDAAKIG